MRILAHCQMRLQRHGLAGRWQFVERRHWRFDFIADTADIDQQQRRLLEHEATTDAADHARLQRLPTASPIRSRPPPTCASVSRSAARRVGKEWVSKSRY